MASEKVKPWEVLVAWLAIGVISGGCYLLFTSQCTVVHAVVLKNSTIRQYPNGKSCGERFIIGKPEEWEKKEVCYDSKGEFITDPKPIRHDQELWRNPRENWVPDNIGR